MQSKHDDIANYIHDMSRDLADMAREHGLPSLTLILELAAIEAMIARTERERAQRDAA
jgi:hypothetical protein